MKIKIGADHAGFKLKESFKSHLTGQGHEVDDVGVFSLDSADYPEQAVDVAKAVAAGEAERGVLVCGSGIGVCMTANRIKGIRAVLSPTVEHAKLGREHNDANIVCIGERLTPEDLAKEIVDTFLNTGFEGGRHQRRVDKIDSLTGE